MRCPICREPFLSKDGKHEVYEVWGRWYCSRACAIKGLYERGILKRGAKLHAQCNECHKKMYELHVSGLMLNGVPYCSEECVTLALLDIGEMVIREVSDEEMHKDGRWRCARKSNKDEHGVQVSP